MCLIAQSCPTLCNPMDCSLPGSSVHGNFPGKNTGVGCHALLQGIFLIQGSNAGLPHCRWILHCLNHQRSPRILEWVTYPFCSISSWLKNQSRVSCIAGRFFTSWATREALLGYIWGTTFFFFLFIFISWRLITLQYCSGFCHTLTWISHGFTCVPHPDPLSHLPLHPIPLGLPSAPAPSTCLMHPAWAGDLFHPR